VSFAQADQYSCILDNVAYKKSPVAHLESKMVAGKKVWEFEVMSNPRDWNRIFKAVKVKDKSEDVHAEFVNSAEGISIDFYLDETDALGMGEGTIKSPVMNGPIHCALIP
jgi:hypothetical protein